MVQNESRVAQRFLELLDSNSSKNLFTNVISFMEVLETKNDPDVTEICLVNNLTEFIEKYQSLKHNLQSYASGNRTLLGDKIAELYD